MDDQPTPSKRPVLAACLAVLVLAVGAGAVVFWPDREQAATATPAPSASASPSLPVSPPLEKATPVNQVDALLDAQAQALVKGDEAGWLAPVDQKLHPRYRTIFQNLRALEVTSADLAIDEQPKMDGAAIKARVWLNYCFSGVDCPAFRADANFGAPKMIYMLTWTPRADSYVITGMADSGVPNHMQPAPWENAALTFAHGARVIVAGPKSQAKNIKRALPLAEKAATVADRYAGQFNNPQKKYRIYMADDKSWKTWYDDAAPKWSAAYHRQFNGVGSDIVMRAGKVMSGTDREITELIQHEMAHAVTLNGNRNRDEGQDQWLVEGIAEYIGYQPRKPQNTDSRDALRYVQSRRGAVKTMAVPQLAEKADDLTVTRLYATGHFAAGCMADQFGEPKMITFVQMVVYEGMDLDPASQVAFGKPFKTVDKTCVNWIRKQL
ncbi:hypothetical protein QLQ12_18820 [Actinoplanes sp. NEAU-A12]|uniref:Peptidase MA-like domain-containing protein n=1 Tax=Actinoplanes sandaracinus TaxID=3045177 RepID=A0ABT6WLQ8_9ACTN|nr:hypothetical protein [Actinoplanes sandaracinus]MDI6100665.1 hypothetical protein [Actinoplanes sandaracinus]